MSGSTATTPMVLDSGLGGGQPSNLSVLTQEFGRLYELPPTKSMKVMTKNLVLKIDRLEKRLLKYANIIAASDDEGWLFNPLNGEHYTVNTEEAKKHLQFRLVGVDTIRKTNLERLNRAVSLSAIAIIGADVNQDLDDAKTKLNNSLATLKQELDDYREKALASSLIPQDEQDAERIRHVAYWESLTTYNERMFEQHLLKLKGGAMKPPSKPAKVKDDTHVRLNSKKRKDPPAASSKNKPSGNKKAKTKRQGNKKGKGQQKDKRNRRRQPVTSSKKQGKQPVGKSKNKSGPSAGSGKKQGGKSSKK